MFTIDWRRRRGSNSHILSDFTRFERDKHAGFARLRELVWAAGFKPTASRFQTGRSDQAELYPGYVVALTDQFTKGKFAPARIAAFNKSGELGRPGVN